MPFNLRDFGKEDSLRLHGIICEACAEIKGRIKKRYTVSRRPSGIIVDQMNSSTVDNHAVDQPTICSKRPLRNVLVLGFSGLGRHWLVRCAASGRMSGVFGSGSFVCFGGYFIVWVSSLTFYVWQEIIDKWFRPIRHFHSKWKNVTGFSILRCWIFMLFT